jgi:HlyD family secretion protein
VGAWLDSGGGSSVYVLDADSRHARLRSVRLGSRNPEQVVVLQGLKPGERIITSSYTAFNKRQTVNLR